MTQPIKAIRLNICDHFDRPLAKDAQGNIYCNVSIFSGEDWHTTTEAGEPSCPVSLDFDDGSAQT